MEIKKTYIQQLSFDGSTYTKGNVVDLLETFNIGCESFPFKDKPQIKDLPKREWPGEHGVDVFIPDEVPIKDYEVDVIFIYSGNEDNMHSDISNFIKFLYGRNTDAVGARLAVYDEHVRIGRKDISVKSVSNDFFYDEAWDDEKLAGFHVTFSVFDPVTEVTPTYETSNGITNVSDLTF